MKLKAPTFSRLRRTLRKLKREHSGVAMIEFAFTAPLVLVMGLGGAETANFVITHMKVSQLAMQVADNASRVGETDVLVARRVFEDDINQSLVGGEKLGERFGIYRFGRVIISSLQQNADGGQEIRWQRCRGAKLHESSFGEEGDGASGTSFPGMGEAGEEITAAGGTAVIFVEVAYDYQSLTPIDYFEGQEITYTAAFNVRDNRNLAGLFQRNPNEPSPVADCDTFEEGRPT